MGKGVLGLNRRELDYIVPRNPKDKILDVAGNKVNAKRLCLEAGLPVPGLVGLVRTRDDLRRFDWSLLPDTFALKPCGAGRGCGIWVALERRGDFWYSFTGPKQGRKELIVRILDILDGSHSRESRDDWAFFEDRVVTSRDLLGDKTFGLPDIRIIFCDGNPALAMTRLPTEKSRGKANLHQGAVGVGIDIETGMTNFAVHNGRSVSNHPDTKGSLLNRKTEGWPALLGTARKAAGISGLGYVGIDMVVDDRKGPLILEINARPGLDIQIANRTGLRSRLP